MVVKTYYKHCLKCEKGFSTFDQSKVYCQDLCECREKVNELRNKLSVSCTNKNSKKCAGCGIYFMRRNGESYCSGACWWDTDRKRRLEESSQKYQTKLIKKICPVCKWQFETSLKHQKYCTNICSQEMQKESMIKMREDQKLKNTNIVKKRRKIPYHVLNMMAEKKRLEEDWNRLT